MGQYYSSNRLKTPKYYMVTHLLTRYDEKYPMSLQNNEADKWWDSPREYEQVVTLATAFQRYLQKLLSDANYPQALCETKFVQSDYFSEQLQLLLILFSPLPEIDYLYSTLLLINATGEKTAGISLVQRTIDPEPTLFEDGGFYPEPLLFGFHNELPLSLTPTTLLELLDAIERQTTRHFTLYDYRDMSILRNDAEQVAAQEERTSFKNPEEVKKQGNALYAIASFLAEEMYDNKQKVLIIEYPASHIPGLRWIVTTVNGTYRVGSPEELSSEEYSIVTEPAAAVMIHEYAYGTLEPSVITLFTHKVSVPMARHITKDSYEISPGLFTWMGNPMQQFPLFVEAINQQYNQHFEH